MAIAKPRPVPPTVRGPRRIATPETVKHLPGLTGFETHTMITNRYGHRRIVALDQDVDRMALAVLDGVERAGSAKFVLFAGRRPQPWLRHFHAR
jgi:hypothetical protein